MDRKIALMLFVLVLAGCASQASKEIPFFKQTDSGNCLQTNLKIALKYYYPEKDYSFEELDKATGRTEGKWTWTSQALRFLTDEGLNSYYYSTTPYFDILEKGEDLIIDYYGETDGNIMIQHTDFDSLYASIYDLGRSDRYENRKLSFHEVETEFEKGNFIIILLDRSILQGGSAYTGHFFTITAINSTHVVAHDTAGTPNKVIDKETFIKAWNAPGTDNDIIIIKGKI